MIKVVVIQVVAIPPQQRLEKRILFEVDTLVEIEYHAWFSFNNTKVRKLSD
jgi:hypothetical protein